MNRGLEWKLVQHQELHARLGKCHLGSVCKLASTESPSSIVKVGPGKEPLTKIMCLEWPLGAPTPQVSSTVKGTVLAATHRGPNTTVNSMHANAKTAMIAGRLLDRRSAGDAGMRGLPHPYRTRKYAANFPGFETPEHAAPVNGRGGAIQSTRVPCYFPNWANTKRAKRRGVCASTSSARPPRLIAYGIQPHYENNSGFPAPYRQVSYVLYPAAQRSPTRHGRGLWHQPWLLTLTLTLCERVPF